MIHKKKHVEFALRLEAIYVASVRTKPIRQDHSSIHQRPLKVSR